MRILRIKNYEKYQNHRTKNPQWIKLHRTILTDQAFIKLDHLSKYVYLGLLILASETDNCIVNDGPYLAHRLAINGSQLDLRPLFRSGLLVASLSTLKRMNVSQRREETETEESRGADAPPTDTQKVVSIKTKRMKTEWPDDFRFTDKHKSIAEGLGLNVHQEFACFRDKAQANGWTYANWDAGFRNWLNQEFKYRQARQK